MEEERTHSKTLARGRVRPAKLRILSLGGKILINSRSLNTLLKQGINESAMRGPLTLLYARLCDPQRFGIDRGALIALITFRMKSIYAACWRSWQAKDGWVRLWGGSIAGITIAAIAALLTGCAGKTAGNATVTPQTIHFDATEAGGLPRNFSTALTGGGGPASWVVRPDAHAPGGGYALVQESADDTSYRFPMCIYNKFEGRDVAVEVSYKAISGKVDEAGGIVLRYRPENYYIARANVLEDNVDLFKTVNGKRSLVVEVPVKVTPDTWHKLRFEAKGPHLTISFDGKVVIEKDDGTFTKAGKVGLWTKADSVSAFADLKIEPAD